MVKLKKKLIQLERSHKKVMKTKSIKTEKGFPAVRSGYPRINQCQTSKHFGGSMVEQTNE